MSHERVPSVASCRSSIFFYLPCRVSLSSSDLSSFFYLPCSSVRITWRKKKRKHAATPYEDPDLSSLTRARALRKLDRRSSPLPLNFRSPRYLRCRVLLLLLIIIILLLLLSNTRSCVGERLATIVTGKCTYGQFSILFLDDHVHTHTLGYRLGCSLSNTTRYRSQPFSRVRDQCARLLALFAG